MTALYRILRAIDDALFDRVFQPLLDRTGSTPARLAPALVGAAFAAFLARILLLHGAGQLAPHVFDAGMSVASAATLYRLYLRHAATPGTPNTRRSSGTYMGLRLIALAGTHLQVLQLAVVHHLLRRPTVRHPGEGRGLSLDASARTGRCQRRPA